MATRTKTISKSDKPERNTSRSALPQLPQVDLLPPEVRDGRRLAVRRRVLVYVVLAVIVVLLLAVAFAFLVKNNAENRLAEVEEHAAVLAAEKKKYSEVTGVIKSINETKEVRNFSVITEVNWTPYIDAIAAQLPDGVTIDGFDVDQASPTASAQQAKDPVLATGLGTISFVARSEDLPNAADWIDALNLIPGFQDAAIQNVERESAGTRSNKNMFVVNASVQINGLALAAREFDDREVELKGAPNSSETVSSGTKGDSDES